MIEGIAELETRTDFAPLLDRLAEYIGEATGKAAFLVDRRVLSSIVLEACMIYGGMQIEIEAAPTKTLHELPDLIDRIEQLLTADANYPDIEIALKAAARRGTKISDEDAEKRAVEWCQSIVEGLNVIRREAPPPPPKRRPGQEAMPKDLRLLIAFIADVWEQHTGQIPKQRWGAPTDATGFISAVVEFIDPKLLVSLPSALQKYITDRRAKREGSWWGL